MKGGNIIITTKFLVAVMCLFGQFDATAKKIVLCNRKPVATQFKSPNTTYVARKDFDLEGQKLMMPENCVLRFRGGRFKNGTIVGNNTKIIATKTLIMENVLIDMKGSWDNIEG